MVRPQRLVIDAVLFRRHRHDQRLDRRGEQNSVVPLHIGQAERSGHIFEALKGGPLFKVYNPNQHRIESMA